MKGDGRCAAASAALAALLWVGACGSAAPPVELSNDWPSRASDYGEATERWTRHGSDSAKGSDSISSQVLDVYATFKSPEWRAAHIDFLRRTHKLPDSEVAALTSKEQAEAAERYEVALMVATYDRRTNDLQKGERSSWRVALVDQDGAEIVADQILRDRRPRDTVKAEFPHMGDFHEPYVVRFPRTVDLMRPGATRFSLKVTGPQGGVVLTWAEGTGK